MKQLITLLFLLQCWSIGFTQSDNNFCRSSKDLHCGTYYEGSTTHEDNDVRHYNGCRNESFNGRDKVFKIS